MAELVNRPPAGRLECLDYLLINLVERFDTNRSFSLNDAKYSDERPNVHDHCKLLELEANLNIYYCPYFTNPLTRSGCALTNSLVEDSQKQKAVSNTINALHGLGLIERGDSTSVVTALGKKLSAVSYASNKMSSLITESIGQYGPLVGMLGRLHVNKAHTFAAPDIPVGYPNSGDEIQVKGQTVRISVGSQPDSNVRTRSVLLAWAVAGGFIEPLNWEHTNQTSPHLEFREYLLRDKRNDRFYKVTSKVEEFFSERRVIARPLGYEHLIKNVNALREKGQQQIRKETKKLVDKIRNRRFAIMFILNRANEMRTHVEFHQLINFLDGYRELFVINVPGFSRVMAQELAIAFAAGIPYSLHGSKLTPLNGVSNKELCKGAPANLIDTLNRYDH